MSPDSKLTLHVATGMESEHSPQGRLFDFSWSEMQTSKPTATCWVSAAHTFEWRNFGGCPPTEHNRHGESGPALPHTTPPSDQTLKFRSTPRGYPPLSLEPRSRREKCILV